MRLAAAEPVTPSPDAGADADIGSRALAMCQLLERPARSASSFGPAPEWKVAAAQAVLGAAGLGACDQTGAEPLYNSRTLVIGPLEFRARQPA
jgi:3'-phosphoadenosine 5'-phosphosulfate (PAPS) 3'-phosphatase